MLRTPPVYAPLSAAALARAARNSVQSGAGTLSALSAHLRERYRATDVLLYGSGTQALSAAIGSVLAARGPRAPIALPAFNCYDIAAAAVAADARVVFYDIDPTTLQPDWPSLESALNDGAGGVVVASLFGFPIDWQQVRRLTDRHRALVIEDAAQASGATWLGEPIGSFGDATVLSFGRGKGWTGGGGGALLLRGGILQAADPAAAGRITGLRTAIVACAQWMLSDPRVYALPAAIPWLHLGETRYQALGPITALSSYSAALLLATADDATAEVRSRQAAAAVLRSQLHGVAGLTLPEPAEGGEAGYLRFPVRVESSAARAVVLNRFTTAGAAASYPGIMSELPEIQAQIHSSSGAHFPGATTLVREIVTLPTHRRVRSPIGPRLRSLMDSAGSTGNKVARADTF